MYSGFLPPLREIPDDETYLRRRDRERFPGRRGCSDSERTGEEDDPAAAKDEGLRREVERREGEDRRQGPRRLPDLHEHLPQGVRARGRRRRPPPAALPRWSAGRNCILGILRRSRACPRSVFLMRRSPESDPRRPESSPGFRFRYGHSAAAARCCYHTQSLIWCPAQGCNPRLIPCLLPVSAGPATTTEPSFGSPTRYLNARELRQEGPVRPVADRGEDFPEAGFPAQDPGFPDTFAINMEL